MPSQQIPPPPLPEVGLFQHPTHPAARRARSRQQCTTSTHDRRDVFNGHLLQGATLVEPYGIPLMTPCLSSPESLTTFSETSPSRPTDPGTFVHFFEEDYRFERLWNNPEIYLPRLQAAAGAITPDFSTYANMPQAGQIWNTYRNFTLGSWLQRNGVATIPNVRLCGPESVSRTLSGAPEHSSLAIGLHGCTKEPENRKAVIEELRIICQSKEPSALIVYGSDAYGVLDYPRELGIPVHLHHPDGRQRSSARRAAC